MERVLVIGGCGAGKTVFSKRLAAITGLPLVHLDVLGWRGEWEKVPHEEFDEKLAAVLETDRWITDGNYGRTIPVRLRRADAVFWFDVPGIVCACGVLERMIRCRGRSRDDMGGDCRETLNGERLRFLWYALTMSRKNRSKISGMLDAAPDVRVTVFRSRRQADRYLKTLAEETPDRDPGKEERDGVE